MPSLSLKMVDCKMLYQESSLNQVQTGIVPNADTSRALEETIEILEAQVESLATELCYRNHQLEQMQQELRYTNQELCTVINSDLLAFEKAEELAREFLANEKPLKDALVELLTTIYNVPVNLNANRQVFANWYGEIEVENAA